MTILQEALNANGCERLRDFYNVGPAQRAALESFVAALAQQVEQQPVGGPAVTRALITKLFNALAYHQLQTRPIDSTEEALALARAYLEAPEPEPDLSALSQKTQEQIRAWLADGTFVDRAIGTMREQERELMAYEKAAPAPQPAQDFDTWWNSLPCEPSYQEAFAAGQSAQPVAPLTDEQVQRAMHAINEVSCGDIQPTFEEMRVALLAARGIKEGK